MVERSSGMAAEGVESKAHSAAEAVRAGTDDAIDQTKAMVRDLADSQRKRAADSIGGVAQALHKSASDLETENDTMARYAKMAADQLDQVSSYLRQSNLNDILTGAENFARRQPYWFVGGAVATGFLLSRFLKSSGGVEVKARVSAGTGPSYGPTSYAGPMPGGSGTAASSSGGAP